MAIVYTPEEAASYLKVHVNTVYTLLRSGRLPAARLGRGWRISGESLDRYLLGQPASRDDVDTAWLDSDISRMAEFEPYDWGGGGMPQLTTVRYVAGRGAVIEGERHYE